jgi:S1-C subfamily serine protease
MDWLLRLVVAIGLAFQAPSSTIAISQPSSLTHFKAEPEDQFFINLTAVRHIVCPAVGSGTGEIIDTDTILTANHVTKNAGTCMDDATGVAGEVIYSNADLDISVMRFPAGTLPSSKMKIDCSGFRKGRTYYAIGWQRGTDLIVNRVIGTEEFGMLIDRKTNTLFNRVALVRGNIIPGMSGGPIVDEHGVLVGTNQATNKGGIGWSRELRDTYLCTK